MCIYWWWNPSEIACCCEQIKVCGINTWFSISFVDRNFKLQIFKQCPNSKCLATSLSCGSQESLGDSIFWCKRHPMFEKDVVNLFVKCRSTDFTQWMHEKIVELLKKFPMLSIYVLWKSTFVTPSTKVYPKLTQRSKFLYTALISVIG